jgi:hypothetical protein
MAFVHGYISKNIARVEKIFRESGAAGALAGSAQKNKGMELVDFLFTMLNFIEHETEETLYLCVALIDFFQAVAESEKLSSVIRFSDVTSYVCQYNPNMEDVPEGHAIARKRLP